MGKKSALYRRMLGRLGERRAVASGVTVLLSLVLVIVPFVLFLSVLVSQAVELSQSAAQWMSSQVENPVKLQQRLEQTPALERLLPYQDQIVDKTKFLSFSWSFAKNLPQWRSLILIFIHLYKL